MQYIVVQYSMSPTIYCIYLNKEVYLKHIVGQPELVLVVLEGSLQAVMERVTMIHCMYYGRLLKRGILVQWSQV